MPPISFPSTVGLEFDWDYPDPLVVSYEIAKLERHFEDPLALTMMLVHDAKEDMRQRFLDEVDPEGIEWKPLKHPADDQVGILRLTEAMYDAAISDEAWSATSHGVFFDAGALPAYWAFHEQPERTKQRIPRRSFIGLSSEFQAKMVLTAESWMDYAIADSFTTTMLPAGRPGFFGPGTDMPFGASYGFSAKGAFVFGIPLGARGFVPVGRGAKGRFVKL